MDITLQITLVQPPPGVDFALQKGSGNDYEIVQTQRSGNTNLSYKFTVTIKGDEQKDALPKLAGPFVQGPTGGKFVYIGIGTYARQINTPWSRRLKIPLSGITWQMIKKIERDPTLILETSVPGTGKDGGPNCATVKPFNGWNLK
jgi:hypothetical protein